MFPVPVNQDRSFDVHPKTGEFFIIDKTVLNPAQYINIVTNFFDRLDP